MGEPSDTLESLNAWLAQVEEPILNADRPIIDPHHHLWHHRTKPYLLEQLWADTESGHRIEATVFVECGSEYRDEGPEHLKSVGETEFVAAIAEEAKAHPDRAQIKAIVAHTDLRDERLDEALDVHVEAAKGLFRGIRQRGPYDSALQKQVSSSKADADLYRQPAFLEGLRRLGTCGFTFDFWNFHVQIPEVTAAAKAAPDTTIIFDHFGGPLGIGPYEGRQTEVFPEWALHVTELAKCENVVAKLGGLAMPVNGWGWHKRASPATSDEIVAAHQPYYQHTIDCFGPDRCMFESNFPVDRQSVSYAVLWNALKKIAAPYSDIEKDALFRGTAKRVYALD